MAVTSDLAPNSNQAIGTGLGDGVNYGSWLNPQRIHATETGTNSSVTTAAGKGHLWFNCFNSSQIPSGATITGVEIIAGADPDGSGFGYLAQTGSNDATLKVFMYNGTSYSSALPFTQSATTGVSFNGDNTELTFAGGAGRQYPVGSLGPATSYVGSSTSLSGLSWDPANQADFGFAFIVHSVTGFTIPFILRGASMRITYNNIDQYTNTVIGVAPNDILKIYGVTTANVEFRSTPGNTVEPDPPINIIYQFESETNATTTNDWTPSGSSSGWVNGASAVDGTYWGRDSNKNVKGWNMDSGTTPSGSTGPDGGVDPSDGSHVSAERYMYTETSSSRHAYAFVARLAIPNMTNTSNNLDLKFWVHAFGTQIGDLYVYIDDASTSNHSSATELAAYESFSGFTATSSVWQQKTISLNSYRDNTTDYYIYFVSQNAAGFRGDFGLDAVQLIES